jgi:hypothetical protein
MLKDKIISKDFLRYDEVFQGNLQLLEISHTIYQLKLF